MADSATPSHTVPGLDPEDFSLILGGPLFQLWRRLHLADDAALLVNRRILVTSAICWLPLFVIAAVEGRLLPHSVTVAFLQDIELQVRFLLVTPLMIGAEILVHKRMAPIVREFKLRALIPQAATAQFDAALSSALRLRNSLSAELLLIIVVYVLGVLLRLQTALDTNSWYATPTSGGPELTLAGSWYAYLSLPLFQFLVCRWYFRLFIWARFLRQVSRIELNLVPTHPDHVGGLGFLSGTVAAFGPIAIAHGALVSGQLADRILHLGAKLQTFKPELLILVLFLLCVVLGPLLVFAPQLARLKRNGLREYDRLAQRYVHEFDAKWLRGAAPPEEPLVGSADLQSLADLNNALEVVRTMRAAPITRASVVQLVVAALLPVAPLLLTIMPLEELLRKLVGILL